MPRGDELFSCQHRPGLLKIPFLCTALTPLSLVHVRLFSQPAMLLSGNHYLLNKIDMEGLPCVVLFEMLHQIIWPEDVPTERLCIAITLLTEVVDDRRVGTRPTVHWLCHSFHQKFVVVRTIGLWWFHPVLLRDVNCVSPWTSTGATWIIFTNWYLKIILGLVVEWG